ncbi:uncharacterized protein [Rutidosis leptorrhynchoides]|uniref:uncharacterized protein n=1 Tax=Rutidosis leptorrhynchoides TaxID=125765 RepID=UPI003A990F1F
MLVIQPLLPTTNQVGLVEEVRELRATFEERVEFLESTVHNLEDRLTSTATTQVPVASLVSTEPPSSTSTIPLSPQTTTVSRATWIYLVVNKGDCFERFKVFLKFVSTQFNKTVKIVRSDNALEFIRGQLGSYLSKEGIVQQTCPNRPQQNGRVERKHRHILDIARAIRFQSSLPLQFWGDCVMTAVYLINRIASSILKNKIPYEILLNKVLTYNHLRVFGCLAIASNPSRNIDKFSERGVPCVFLGYPAHQKGYKLYNLLTKSTFISRDVLFYEHIFPFSKSTQGQILHPLYIDGLPAPERHVNSYDDIHITAQDQTTTSTHTVVDEPSTSQSQPTLRRSTRQSNSPVWHKDYIVQQGNDVLSHVPMANQVTSSCLEATFETYMTALMANSTPRSFKEAILDKEWCSDMNNEIQALESNDTWDITYLPKDKKAIPCH